MTQPDIAPRRWTLIPVRGLASGKTRLAAMLSPAQRAELNGQLLERVLGAVRDAEGTLARCVVASAGADALGLARSLGAQALQEAQGTGLNAALERAATHARGQGAHTLLVLASDLPDVDAGALRRLLAAVPAGGAAILEDKSGTGTNGLVLPARHSMPFAFGADSLAKHRAALADSGLVHLVWNDPALAFDLDTPEDWRAYSARQRAA